MSDEGSKMATEQNDVMTPDEVAQLLHVSKRTVERLNLPYVKVGRARRYMRSQLLTHLMERAV